MGSKCFLAGRLGKGEAERGRNQYFLYLWLPIVLTDQFVLTGNLARVPTVPMRNFSTQKGEFWWFLRPHERRNLRKLSWSACRAF